MAFGRKIRYNMLVVNSTEQKCVPWEWENIMLTTLFAEQQRGPTCKRLWTTRSASQACFDRGDNVTVWLSKNGLRSESYVFSFVCVMQNCEQKPVRWILLKWHNENSQLHCREREEILFWNLSKLIGCVSAPAVKLGWRSQQKSNNSWLSWIETSKAVHRSLWGEVELGCLISSVYEESERVGGGEQDLLLFPSSVSDDPFKNHSAAQKRNISWNNTFNSPGSLC